MAASGVMADFARMPTNKKVGVFVAIGLVLGFLYYRFVFKSLRDDLAQVEAEHQQNVQANNALEADIPKFAALRDKMAELQAKITENQKALPTEAEVPAFFETLERKVRESGVEIAKWKKQPEEPIDSFVKVPVEIELTGTFMQLKRFFASLVQKSVAPAIDPSGETFEERERIVSIENLTLATPVVRNREIILSAKFLAVTYRQEDKAAAAPGNPGAASAPTTPAAAPPTGGSTPPLPSARTPAGAKARTEDALQKSDDRQQNAGSDGSARLKGGL